MKILVTGGCGYKGSVLVPQLVRDGHEVTVVDAMWFGNHLDPDLEAVVFERDLRNTETIPVDDVDIVIHLANVANDPGVELDQTLSWEVNALATQRLADRAVRAGVKQFIFASSGSVYGVKDEPDVTEDLELVPISAYNKTKMVAERALLSYSGDMQVHNIRPATVCGVSPRMRFDVSVNMFAKQGYFDGRITVFGGNQVRPNIHIDDLVNVYRHFIDNPDLPSGAYNAGFENIEILRIAKMVKERTGARIVVTPSNDPRSYRQNSDKLLATGFRPQKTVADAIDEVIGALASGDLVDRDEWYTVRWMAQSVVRPGDT
ncbi:SDR family oxidoreductase [Candidatus Nanopelagicales bacterium]|nr:SDR family oxidoreductase [Candidatus Nanopelagicales bacterium]